MSAGFPQLVRVDTDTGEDPFLAFLRTKGVVPFTPESVEAYKTEQIRKAAPRFWERTSLITRWRHRTFTAIGACVAATFFACVSAGWNLFAGDEIRLHYSVMLIAVGGLAVVACFRLVEFFDRLQVKDDAVWRLVPIALYNGFMPSSVSRLARQVDVNSLSANIFVDELLQGSHQLDPFLVVQYHGRTYYIAVWDESYVPPASTD